MFFSLAYIQAGFWVVYIPIVSRQRGPMLIDVVCHCGECRCRGGAAQALRTRAECVFFWWWVVLPAQQKIHSTVSEGCECRVCSRKCTQQQATGVHRDVLMFLPSTRYARQQTTRERALRRGSFARPRTLPPIHNNGAGCTIFVHMNSSLSCLLRRAIQSSTYLDTASVCLLAAVLRHLLTWEWVAVPRTKLAQYARPAWRGKQ